ncbi:unnamed protein product [Echinostoma caproni]|uniref:G_PROTEIN_RECEP_F1_2 domain-containing protein n=1 Tax=Echinostoma caproni TaxID=27848 RepID=A0A183BCH6_9TREM|nr:unnamed protein product [Echinostoma caproni]
MRTQYLYDLDEWKAVHEVVRLVCFRILIPCVCVIGITTNVMNIAVLARPRMRSSTNMYLLALAICDFIYGCVLAVMSLRTIRFLESSFAYMNTMPFQMAVGNFCSNTAAWLTCAFTIERFIAISSPILARKICTRKRCKWIITVIILFTFLITVPDFFKIEVKLASPRRAPTDNCSDTGDDIQSELGARSIHLPYILTESDFGKKLRNIGWSIILIVLVFIIPLTLLTVFNGLLIRSVVKTSLKRKHLNVTSKWAGISTARHYSNARYHSNWMRQVTLRTSIHKSDDTSIETPSKHKQYIQATDEGLSTNMSTFTYPTLADDRVHPQNSFSDSGNKHVEELEHEDGTSRKSSIMGHRSFNGDRIKWVRRGGPRLSERHRITVMLIVVVVTFCIFTMPSAIILLAAELHTRDNGVRDIKFRIAGNFVNLALAINSSLNFFLYSWLSMRFRRTFHALIKCRE